MKKILLFCAVLFHITTQAQLLSWSPDFITESSVNNIISVDATKGNQGLLNYTPTNDVYVHIGVITNKSSSASDWKYVKFTWGTTTAQAQCAYISANKWSYTISGSLRSFFGITDPTETIQKIAILFRNGTGSKVQRNSDGSDMYIPVYDNALHVRIDEPYRQPMYYPVPEPISKNVGDALSITAKSNQSGTLTIRLNGNIINSSNTTVLGTSTTIVSAGNQQIIASVTNGVSTTNDTLNFVAAASTPIAPLPVGVTDGINYEPGDTSAVLVLYAPYKQNIFVIGDFNNWTASSSYQMSATPDGNRFWIRITGLTPGTEYAYQYLIDGSLKVADYNTEKILDPNNDSYISPATYPNLKPYPVEKTTGIVSILQTAKPQYNWQDAQFVRPDKKHLMIYELLLRDFVANQNWQTLKDTLNYLKRLGINAIEVMPFNEFEGNNSWGYNPSFYFAPDKAYGTETALKNFINECHLQGIAVIMDMVLNHSFGSSPMVQMYWDAANNRPATNSPWFNPVPKHAYNVGYDFNHESSATKDFVNRVLAFWLNNYHIDGFRFDLAKGFTQTQTCDNNGNNCDVAAWGHYDASRVATWKRIYDTLQSISPNSYCILEMLADNNEEEEEANYGMLLWGNLNYNFNQATMGYNDGSDFSWGLHNARGWSQPHLITYQESHDEERLMWKNEQYGNSSGGYNIKTISTGLKRNAMATAFWAVMPGPKMLWQFGELGYDYSINRCPDGSINSNCRTDPKPIVWNYYQEADRQNLYNVYAALLKLRTTAHYFSTFTTGSVSYNLSAPVKWLQVADTALKVVVIGNFDVVNRTSVINFPETGLWYSYLTDSVANITTTAQNIQLQPGEYYVFTNKNVQGEVLPLNWLSFTATNQPQSVLLSWSVSNEVNNEYYQIERSSDAIHYTVLAQIPATKNATYQTYTYSDTHPLNALSYYRIKQVDVDGKFSYSKEIPVYRNESAKQWLVYPNPAKDYLYVAAQQDMHGVFLLLTDASGRKIFSKEQSVQYHGDKIVVPLQGLSKGIYFLKMNSNELSKTEKIIVP